MRRHGSEAAPNPQSTIPDAGHGTTHDNTPGIVSVQSDRIPTPQMGMHVVWFGSEAAPNPQSTIPAKQNRQCKYDTSPSPQSLRRPAIYLARELVFRIPIRTSN
jgi:hypothetical protein